LSQAGESERPSHVHRAGGNLALLYPWGLRGQPEATRPLLGAGSSGRFG